MGVLVVLFGLLSAIAIVLTEMAHYRIRAGTDGALLGITQAAIDDAYRQYAAAITKE